MIPFQLHRRIPLVRRPFYQRDTIAAERDALAAERDALKAELAHQTAHAQKAPKSRLPALLQHPHLIHVPNRPSQLTYQPAAPLPATDFLARLAFAFREAVQRAPEELGPIWGSLVGDRHREVAELAAGDDPAELGRYLARLGETDLSFGFLAGREAHEAALNLPEYHQQISLPFMDRILSLAEHLGCVQLENPEQGPWGVSAQMAVDELLSKIATALNIDISPPRYLGSYWGLGSHFGIFSHRIIDCLYAAVRAQQILAVSGGGGIMEIGGGAALTAFYARRLGIQRYTVVDLP